MKICFVTTISLTMKAFVLPLAAFLSENGHEVTLICDEDAAFFKAVPKGCRYIPVKMKRGIHPLGILAIHTMKKIFRCEQFDIVQYSTPNAALYASYASKAAGIPVRLYCQWGIRYVGFEGWRRTVFKAIEKKVCELATVIEPDSRGNIAFSVSERLYPAEKAHVVWNGSSIGVDLKKYDIEKREAYRHEIRERYGIGQTERVIGFTGRFCRDKGMEELLAAFERLTCKDKIKARLMLVGEVPDAPDISASAQHFLRTSPDIVKTGWVDCCEKYYSAMDLFVLPSYREGFATSVIEAEAMGVPAVITALPFAQEAVLPGKTGLCVGVKNTEELYEALRGLLLNDAERERMGQCAAQLVRERFDAQILLQKIMADRVALVRQGEKNNR